MISSGKVEGLECNRPRSMKERLAVLGVGILANHAIVLSFDYLLYPFVLWQLGLVLGCITMTVISAFLCYLTLLFYDWSKRDWLGIEAMKGLREGESVGRFPKAIRAILARSHWFALIILSVKFDPFIATAYLRSGSYRFDGMSRSDWRVFWTSVVISNVYWSFVAFTGVSVIQWLWERNPI